MDRDVTSSFTNKNEIDTVPVIQDVASTGISDVNCLSISLLIEYFCYKVIPNCDKEIIRSLFIVSSSYFLPPTQKEGSYNYQAFACTCV